METATDQFPKVNLLWTPGVIVEHLPMLFCAELTHVMRNQQIAYTLSNQSFKCNRKKTLTD